MKSFVNDVYIKQLKSPSGAATSAVTSDTIDVSNFDGCALMVTVTTKTNSTDYNKVAVYQRDDNTANISGATKLKEYTVTDDNLTVVFDVIRPRESLGGFLLVYVTRATSTALSPITAFCYNGRVKPVDNDDENDNGTYVETVVGAAAAT